MRQTLFYIPEQIAGLPVFGVGWLLVVWALVVLGYVVWAIALRRQPWSEIAPLLPFALIVAAAVTFVFPLLSVAGLGLPIRGYGMMLLCAVLLGIGTAMYRVKQMGLDPEIISSLATAMFVAGILGARLFFVVQNWHTFRRASAMETLFAVAKFTEGGLVVYGSLIGALLAFAFVCWRKQLHPLRLADVVAPSMVLGLAIGRIGCLLNGCCYGGLCEAGPLAITFPRFSAPETETISPPYQHQLAWGQLFGFRFTQDGEGGIGTVNSVVPNSPASRAGVEPGMVIASINGVSDLGDVEQLFRAAGTTLRLITDSGQGLVLQLGAWPPRSLPVHPTQLYATLNALLIFAIAWFYFPFQRRAGEVAGIVLTIYPVTRILLEWVRTDEGSQFGTGLTISQLVSLAFLVLMLGYWVVVLNAGKRPQLAG